MKIAKMVSNSSVLAVLRKIGAVCLVLLLVAYFGAAPANAQSSQNSGFGQLGPTGDAGLVYGAIAAIAVIAAVIVTVVVVHHRHVITGCVAEADGKRTLVDSNKNVYALVENGPRAPTGDRVKFKGHKSGPSSARSFEVEKVVRDYGRCPV